MKKLIVLTLGIMIGLSVLAYAAFDPQGSVTRNPHIKDIKIVLFRTIDPKVTNQQSIKFTVTIDDQDDTPMAYRNGNLIPHLTPTQITALEDFMDAMWTKAEDEILP